MIEIFKKFKDNSELIDSKLFNEDTFYKVFLKDLKGCKSELILESPFVSNRRIEMLLPVLTKLKSKKVKITIITKDPIETEGSFKCVDGSRNIAKLQHAGIHVVFSSGHHRKIAILDRKILYEGSLNILSQASSKEIMRRIESVPLAWQMIRFNELDKYIQ